MKKILSLVLLLAICTTGASAKKYIFYLHGRIVEEMGVENAVSNEHGRYDYKGILAELGKNGNVVLSEARAKNTDANEYAKKIAGQIDSLIKKGIPAKDISVIGASKGGYITSIVAAIAKQKDIRYVVLGACIEQPEAMSGKVLAIHEATDTFTNECDNKEANNDHYTLKILNVNTGKKHGFLYSPMKEWVQPAMNWIK